MGEFACKFKEFATLQCLNDKAIVPVGEPGHPVSTGVRAQHGSIVVGAAQSVAMDHDFHVAGIIPSVCFMVDIPKNPRDSFYNDLIHVTVKDKVFQPSSPLRHAAETVAIIRKYYSGDDVNMEKPILIRYTDGGPDHRTTYKSVKVAALAQFIALDLDMIVCARTAPCGSYVNPAERCMSLLNLALQNVALERGAMGPEYEMQVKSASSLKKLRNLESKNKQFETQYVQSVNVPVKELKDRFKRLKWKQEAVVVHNAATIDELVDIADYLKYLMTIFTLIKISMLTQKLLTSSWLIDHSRSRHYIFQVSGVMS